MHADVARAPENLAALKANPYPGRVVMGGVDETRQYLVLACAIMGRSANSRNRVYVSSGGLVRTALAKEDPKADTALTLYNAMDEWGPMWVASNGDQTDTIVELRKQGKGATQALLTRSYEPDKPNYTPRITAVWQIDPLRLMLSRICKLEHADETAEPLHDQYDYYLIGGQIPPGIGWCLQTYVGDGNPLPTYRGKPYSLPLKGDIGEVASSLWSALNPDNRVGLAVKFIEMRNSRSEVALRNKHWGD